MAILAMYIAESKNRSVAAWGLIVFLSPIIGIFILCIVSDLSEEVEPTEVLDDSVRSHPHPIEKGVKIGQKIIKGKKGGIYCNGGKVVTYWEDTNRPPKFPNKIGLLTDIKGGPYVSFLVANESDEYDHWSQKASFLEDGFYDFFSDCFAMSNEKFIFYGDTQYKEEQLMLLLRKKLQDINAIRTLEQFESFISGTSENFNYLDVLKYAGIEWKTKWKEVVCDLSDVNRGLIDIVQSCIHQYKVLWVSGV